MGFDDMNYKPDVGFSGATEDGQSNSIPNWKLKRKRNNDKEKKRKL